MRAFRWIGILLLSSLMLPGAGRAAQVRDDALPRVVREKEHDGQVVFVKPAAPGGRIVSVDYTGGIFLWDPRSLRQIDTSLRAPFPVRVAALADADTLLVVQSTPQDLVAKIDLQGRRAPQVLGRIGGEIQSMSSARPDGAVRAVAATPEGVHVRDIGKDGVIRPVRDLAVPDASALALSGDGRFLALATSSRRLALIDVDTGLKVWERAMDDIVSSLSVNPDAGAILAGYDNLIGFRLRRVDQLDARTGKTRRQVPLAPCSALQVDIVDRDRGVAICAPTTMDMLVNMGKRIVSTIVVWSLAGNAAPSRTVLPRAVPGVPGYLPFRAGVGWDPSTGTLLAAGADGAVVALKFNGRGLPAGIERLAPGPSATQRLVVDARARRIYSIGQTLQSPGGISRKQWYRKVRTAIDRALPGTFSETELQEALADIDDGQAGWLGNHLTRWDMDTGSAEPPFLSDFGVVAAMAPGHPGAPASTLVEQLPAPTSAPLASAILAVTRSPDTGEPGAGKRRLVSIDASTGLLHEGVRHSSDGPDNSRFGFCGSSIQSGNVYLSGDGGTLVLACLALKDDRAPDDFLRPEYDLFTYPLEVGNTFPPGRIRIKGLPSFIQLSNDGRLAAVLTSVQSKKTEGGQPSLDMDHALAIVDIQHAQLLKVFPDLPEPAMGNAIAFAPNGKHAYIALRNRVFDYAVDAGTLTAAGLEAGSGTAANIAGLAVDGKSSLLAVSRFRGTTEVLRLDDGKRVATVSHPGETITQICFDEGIAGRLVAATLSDGIILFDYLAPARVADFLSGDNGDWLAVAPDGTFSGSIGGELGITVSNGRTAVAIDQLYDAYFRPDMLRRHLAGEAAVSPSADTVRRALGSPPPALDAQVGGSANDQARLDISIQDAGGGVGGLRVFHNGKLARDLGPGELGQGTRIRRPGKQTSYRLQLTLPVGTGANDYILTGLNADRTTQGRFTKLTVQGPPSPVPARKAYILAIGSNTFDAPGFPRLYLAENSAHALGNTLTDLMSRIVGRENVVLMDLVGAGSRFGNVERALADLESKARPDDIVVTVIVTHGKILPSGELLTILADTRSNGEGALPGTRLVAAVNRIPALTQVLVLDICHAGAISGKVAANYQERFAVFAGTAGIHVLTSTSAEEPALAAYKGTTVFSHFLLEGLAHPPAGTSGARSLKAIADQVRRQVSDIAAKFAYNQIPSAYSFGKDILIPQD